MKQVVKQLLAQRKRAQQEIERIDLAIKALTSLWGSAGAAVRRKPKFSAAAIARIREAQKRRWAKIKAAQK